MNLSTFYQIEVEAEALLTNYRESLARLDDEALVALTGSLNGADALRSGLAVGDMADLIDEAIERRGIGPAVELTAEELAAFDAVAARQTIRAAADAIRSEVI